MISKIRLILLKALLFSVGGNVIIVIGGDDNYKNEDKEKRSVISVWARRAMSVQFSEEYLDGRKSFIFSWGEKHRPIHEEALKHFFDPGRNGERFIYQLPTQRDPSLQPGQVKPVGSITSRCSGNEPAILPSGGTESAAEIEPITPAEATPVEVEEGKCPLDTGNEPAILPSGGTESTAEIEPITPAEAIPVEVEGEKCPLDRQEKGTYFIVTFC